MIGQLLDDRRYLPLTPNRLAVLFPHRPAEDLCDLIASCGMALTYATSSGVFTTIERPSPATPAP